MTKKQSFFIGIFYLIVPVIANFLVLSVTLMIDFPLPKNSEYKIWIAFLDAHKILTGVPTLFSFIIAILFAAVFVAPVFKGSERAKINAANSPVVLASLGILGWILMLLFQTAIVVFIHLSSGEKIYGILKNSATFTLLAAMLAFVVTFLILETANRAKILKLYFPRGNIAKTKGLIRPSLRLIFLMYYIGVGVFPTIVLLFALVTKEKNLGIEISYNLIMAMSIFLPAGISITLLLADILRKPLKDLSFAARRISEGDLKNQVRVSSGDEIGMLGDSFNEMSASLLEKEFMKDVFGKIVPPEVREHLLGDGMSGISLGGEKLRVTILFCDIRGFTSLSEKMQCEKVVQLLNKYFTGMGECIARHNGIINKYIGDAIMAIFGAPMKSTTHAKDAYLAALEMRKALVQVNQEFEKSGFPQIKFGIGIHTGVVLAGNIGSASRMEYTVIGDNVNIASRIEGLCKEYRRDILLSESTASEISFSEDEYFPRPQFLCDSPIRGKEEKIRLYESVENP